MWISAFAAYICFKSACATTVHICDVYGLRVPLKNENVKNNFLLIHGVGI